MGRHPGANWSRRRWIRRWAISWVRGPNWNTGMHLVSGSSATKTPKHLRMAPQTRTDFIQLHVPDLQLLEGTLVQDLGMRSSPQAPPRDGRLANPKHPLSRTDIQPF